MRKFVWLAMLIAVTGLLLFTSQQADAQVFSVDLPSAGANGVFEDDLLAPGLFFPPPPIVLPGAAALLAPAPPPVDIDALSFAIPFLGPHTVVGADFSVAPGSVGVAGTAVFGESGGLGFADEPADIFGSGLGGGNFQILDGDGVAAPGLAPPMGLIEPGSNTDAWDALAPFGPLGLVHWSVTAAAAGGGSPAYPVGTSGADIWVSAPVAGYSVLPAAYAPAGALGLALLDDIDALSIIEDGLGGFTAGDTIYFSLAPGSPTLGALTASPADILVTTFAGVPGIAFPAAALGLLGLGLPAVPDDIDALQVFVVPEPSTCALAVVGLIGLGLAARRRRGRA